MKLKVAWMSNPQYLAQVGHFAGAYALAFINETDLEQFSRGLDEAMKELSPENIKAFVALARQDGDPEQKGLLVRGLRIVAARLEGLRTTIETMARDIEAP